ncbi:Pre-rRNA-processing protein pno1 (macronuclear) [Tetrahymena thermophila SB210]|uniref:Pre-rRNA-processing protein pno1 n=1 Tax=Tetrahymena thermophila (strain SB210) TaxID=312017 RepID=I7MA94_TETTS|nr:Pre-rRNA-processing protein pno1 [Tetrahymena thermophila SB210]EAS03952.2 Pre-rRNA-processing protein pno1 [Tetrahymena thermophila SB210]|eukprot:XP_001024197.2 Pre-rRNA-processing protein pno1 [Tetrahymena thermophila SB210]
MDNQEEVQFDQNEEIDQEFDKIDEQDIVLEKIDEFAKDIDFEKPEEAAKKSEMRRIPVPPHRLTPLRQSWEKIVTTVVENMKLQIRMNTKKKAVEIKSSEHTPETSAVQKTADFLKAFMLGFELNDAIALLRLDDLYIESFEVKDVKNLSGDNLSRAIGRITGEKGKTKFAIENASRTRIVVADKKIHILGSFSNIKCAREAICSLIMGSPPGKVYSQLKFIAKRYLEKF